MLLEYADRGSLEEAIQNKRFQRKSDKSQLDMVRRPSWLGCAFNAHPASSFLQSLPTCSRRNRQAKGYLFARRLCEIVCLLALQLSVFRTLLDIVSGMQYLHSLGLVHGDNFILHQVLLCVLRWCTPWQVSVHSFADNLHAVSRRPQAGQRTAQVHRHRQPRLHCQVNCLALHFSG
jgi:hypothetical protein